MGLYSDEGLSATSPSKRVGLLRMLEDARQGKFDIIVVKNLSRLSRNLMDCMNIIYELRSLPRQVGILFETENMFTLDKSVDFTLQVLSLVAQEESHKKSEAMLASYKQRFSQGNFMKPDLLGYDRSGVNEITVNEEEAVTVQLIFMLYLAGHQPKEIADILVSLGRKTHTRRNLDGNIRKEGEVKWSAGTVMSVLKNERRCGDVLAQKTWTPNYLDHRSKRNDNVLPQYYATDQHLGIVSREDFLLTQRLIRANKGGWDKGLPVLEIFEEGPLSGSVLTVPNWLGFGAEDYNRAALRANGAEEETLQAIQERDHPSEEIAETVSQPVQTGEFSHQYAIDSDDYELFPDKEAPETLPEPEKAQDGFSALVEEYRDRNRLEAHTTQSGGLADCEVARAQLFSYRDKPYVTLDSRGITFSKSCFRKLDGDQETPQEVEIAYNPIERLLFVRAAKENTPGTLKWIRDREGYISMRRCASRGLSGAVYDNMKWNGDYKYRFIGTKEDLGDETVLVFSMEEPIIIVPAKKDIAEDMDTENMTSQEARQALRGGNIPENYNKMPNLDDFELGNGPMATAAKKLSRSRAIYYDELLEKTNGEISLADLGEKRFDPEYIRQMIRTGLSPKEGWHYLKGMAVIRKSSFTIYPSDWADSFGELVSSFRERPPWKGTHSKSVPYGWTLGLDIPSRETAENTIACLRNEMAG